jgi:hypothetical protein
MEKFTKAAKDLGQMQVSGGSRGGDDGDDDASWAAVVEKVQAELSDPALQAYKEGSDESGDYDDGDGDDDEYDDDDDRECDDDEAEGMKLI